MQRSPPWRKVLTPQELGGKPEWDGHGPTHAGRPEPPLTKPRAKTITLQSRFIVTFALRHLQVWNWVPWCFHLPSLELIPQSRWEEQAVPSCANSENWRSFTL